MCHWYASAVVGQIMEKVSVSLSCNFLHTMKFYIVLKLLDLKEKNPAQCLSVVVENQQKRETRVNKISNRVAPSPLTSFPELVWPRGQVGCHSCYLCSVQSKSEDYDCTETGGRTNCGMQFFLQQIGKIQWQHLVTFLQNLLGKTFTTGK